MFALLGGLRSKKHTPHPDQGWRMSLRRTKDFDHADASGAERSMESIDFDILID